MRTAFLLLTLASVLVAYDPVFVLDLKALVPYDMDKRQLNILDKDQSLIRSDKKKKLDVILERQDENIKNKYKEVVEAKQLKYSNTMKARFAAARDLIGGDATTKEFLTKYDKLNTDMSISEKEARQGIKQLMNSMDKNQRDIWKNLMKIQS
ncbi:unnamed protein product [Strongylus vulgaris]|uniref:SXP/RAL-2 family protein Ani s 5-like cation-binding domain-containing protein n=1 Tax=Strongylus vulgaris TaxID=40348 RepID=A0A3P7I0F4_STRVU|nr:unnamed protein product [Strongylus vulgaris]